MGFLRAIVRAFFLCVFTAVMYVLTVSGKLLLRPSKKLKLGWTDLMLKNWARGLCRILGIKITVYNQPPQSPFLLVSNHLSYVDILVFASQVACAFIAKKEVASWPAVGSMCRAAETIFVDRESRRDLIRVNRLIEQTLNEKRGIILFPEGTSTEGSSVRPFNPSLLDHAAKNGFPVNYASISYSTLEPDPPAYMSVCWWGDMTFMSHFMGLLKLRSVRAEVLFGAQPVKGNDRKLLAAELHRAVSSEFIPVVDMEDSCKTVVQ